MSQGRYFHAAPGALTTRTLDELMKELEAKWNRNEQLTPVEHELFHRWRVGRLTERTSPLSSHSR